MELISEGWNNARIGATLFISPRTVKNHVASILEKLELDNRIQAAVCAVRVGLAGDGNGDVRLDHGGYGERASSTVANTIIG